MYNREISENLRIILRKLAKKDKSLYEQVKKKINEIIHSYYIEHYKNLRYTADQKVVPLSSKPTAKRGGVELVYCNMKDSKRVHIGHFVLVFQFDKKTDTILFDDFDHHDNIYRKKGN